MMEPAVCPWSPTSERQREPQEADRCRGRELQRPGTRGPGDPGVGGGGAAAAWERRPGAEEMCLGIVIPSG